VNKTSAFIGRVIVAGALVVISGVVQPAAAQTPGPWIGRVFFGIDGGAQVTSSPYTSQTTFTLHAESATLEAKSEGSLGPVFAARGGFRIWKSLAVGVGVTAFWSTDEVAVKASLPHPFFFNQPRSVSGTASGLQHDETMVAVEASWMVPLSRRMDLTLFGGPAFFSLRQDMVTTVLFTETYPFDTATFTGVETASVSESATGFTAGADVSFLFSKSIGLGGHLRFSRASASPAPAGGQPTTVDVGGLQVGGGLRFRF